MHESDRSLNFHWLIESQFLVYSKINDSVCSLQCILFCKNNKNKLTKLRRFSKWHKVGDKLKCHVNNDTHSTAMTAASGFKKRYEFLLLNRLGTTSFAIENSVISGHVSTLLKYSMKVDVHLSSVCDLCSLLKPT